MHKYNKLCTLSPYMVDAVCMLSMLVSSPVAAPIELPYHHELALDPVLIKSTYEVVLQQLCYLATGIQQLLVGPDRGTFTLGSGDASLEFPPGAVKKKTAVCYAIILHGPFVFPAGCKPGSVVVYINMDGATLVKPVNVFLSHWCSGEEGDGNSLKFLRAPHKLEAGKEYVFKELEGGDFTTHANVGILTIREPQCLYCVEMKSEEIARYNALTFQRCGESGSPLYFRIQLMCDSKEMNKVCVAMCVCVLYGCVHECGHAHTHMRSSYVLPFIYTVYATCTEASVHIHEHMWYFAHLQATHVSYH